MSIFHHFYLYFSVFLMMEKLLLVFDLIDYCFLRKNFLLRLCSWEWRMKLYKVPPAIILEDKDVKFSRVFPWGEDRIRLFPHFTDGGAKSLRDFLKEERMSWHLQPEPKVFCQSKGGLWILNILKNWQVFKFIVFMVRLPDQIRHAQLIGISVDK